MRYDLGQYRLPLFPLLVFCTLCKISLSLGLCLLCTVLDVDRTPLNITAVGMDLVLADLKKLGDVVPPFLLETMEACQDACGSSLEVRLTLPYTSSLTSLFLIHPLACCSIPHHPSPP